MPQQTFHIYVVVDETTKVCSHMSHEPQLFTCTTTKCVLVHSGFHYILSEFGHFNLMKLFNPWWMGTSCYGQWIVH
jgi:hypothetical protein